MTVKVEKIEGGIPHNTIMVAGLIAAVVFVYLTYANVLTGTQYFAFFGGLATVAALVWGSHTIKHLCSYGIGTGVPSAGMLAFGSGVIAMLFATKYGIAAPIVAVILAAVVGAILGYVANNVLNMKIPVMIMSIIEMAVIGALVLMGYAAMMSGSFELSALTTGSVSILGLSLPSYQASFLGGALIVTAFMLGGIAIQHPFNACLGPDALPRCRVRVPVHDCSSGHVHGPHQHECCTCVLVRRRDWLVLYVHEVHRALETRCGLMA